MHAGVDTIAGVKPRLPARGWTDPRHRPKQERLKIGKLPITYSVAVQSMVWPYMHRRYFTWAGMNESVEMMIHTLNSPKPSLNFSKSKIRT